MSISRRITSISFASSSSGSAAFCMMSQRMSTAIFPPVFGTLIQYTVRSNDV